MSSDVTKPKSASLVLGVDVEWMRRYLADDAAAFESIYAAYSDAVYGYLMKRVRVAEERDELFQKIWMKFHRSRELWSEEYPLLQWLFVISRSVLIDRKREMQRTTLDRSEHPGEGLEREIGNLRSAEENPEEILVHASETQGTEDLLEGLAAKGFTDDQIAVIRLRAIDEEEYERIALKLGKTPTNVRKIYSRAIEKLKELRWNPVRGRDG